MKKLTSLIVIFVVMVGLTLATGVAYASQLDQPLAGIFSLGQGSWSEVQGFIGTGSGNTAPQQLDNSSGTLSDEDVEIIGTVTSITTDTLVVDATVIAITVDTEFEDEVVVGDMVKVEAFTAEDGTLTARNVELYEEEDDDEYVEIIGTLTSITTDTLVVDTTVISITSETEFEDEVVVGDMVKVEALLAEDGTLTARSVELYEEDDDEEIVIIGTVTSVTTDTLVVDATVIAITPETEFEDEVVVGDMVKVKAFTAEDGTLTARKVELYEEDDDDSKPGYGYDQKVMVTGVVESFSSESIIVSGIPISITEETKIMGDIQVGSMVKVHAFIAEDGGLYAWKIKWLPDAVGNPGHGYKIKVFEGTVDSLSADLIVVSGMGFAITSETKINGEVSVGDTVKVQGYVSEEGVLTARKISSLKDGSKADSDPSAGGNTDPVNNGNKNDAGNGGGGQDKGDQTDKGNGKGTVKEHGNQKGGGGKNK